MKIFLKSVAILVIWATFLAGTAFFYVLPDWMDSHFTDTMSYLFFSWFDAWLSIVSCTVIPALLLYASVAATLWVVGDRGTTSTSAT